MNGRYYVGDGGRSRRFKAPSGVLERDSRSRSASLRGRGTATGGNRVRLVPRSRKTRQSDGPGRRAAGLVSKHLQLLELETEWLRQVRIVGTSYFAMSPS